MSVSESSHHSLSVHRIGSDAEALSVARALADRFAVDAATRDRERRLPHGEMDELSRSGLLAITVPRAFGGIDVSAATLAEVTAILSAADSSIGQIPQNHFYILEALRTDGTEDQQRRFFARALAGDRFGNALSEASRNPVNVHETKITPDGAGFRINGRKFYSTGVLFAHWVVIFADDPEGKGTMSFVPAGSPGLTLVDDWSSFGQRTTGSGTTLIENVFVPAENVVAHHKGFERPTTIGSIGQIIHAAIDLGIARAAFAETLDYVRTKSRPWMDSGLARASDDPYTIERVGNIGIQLEAASALLERAGRSIDVAKAEPTEAHVVAASIAVAGAKVLTTEVALLASNTLFELAGSRATLIEANLDRYWRNARTHTLHDPVRWKYHVVGNFLLNGVPPKRHGAV